MLELKLFTFSQFILYNLKKEDVEKVFVSLAFNFEKRSDFIKYIFFILIMLTHLKLFRHVLIFN